MLPTKEVAETYFGDWKSAVGKTIKITGYYSMGAALFQLPCGVVESICVLASIPANTDFQLKLVVAWGTNFTGDAQYGFQQPGWNLSAPDFSCYVLLPSGVSASNLINS